MFPEFTLFSSLFYRFLIRNWGLVISKIVSTIAAFFFESSFFEFVISVFNAGRKCWI
ncbi:MAG: hypothetical protein ACR5LA_07915 [Wolbachia sp.]